MINEYIVTRLDKYTAGKRNADIPEHERIPYFFYAENIDTALNNAAKRFPGEVIDISISRDNVDMHIFHVGETQENAVKIDRILDAIEETPTMHARRTAIVDEKGE
jgi:TnpA family transposase